MSKSNVKPKILMLMSGSIACYKACTLVSTLVKNGFDVKIAASTSALRFIGEATLEGLTGHPVYSDLWHRGSAMEHIHLERWADLIIATPASAHFINRIAHGIGDDLLTTIFLAHEFKKPFLIAPAMNTAMYLNPVTQKSLTILKEYGVKILEAASGVLACGETGYGRLLEPDLIFQEVTAALKNYVSIQTPAVKATKAPRVLVTAGGTREAIDDVRFLTNASTGATGEKIASDLAELGFDVTLDLASSSTIRPQLHYELKNFDSFQSLENLMREQLETQHYDLVIHSAAVSDFTVDKTVGKLESDQDLTLTLKRNPKIVNQLKTWSKNKNLKVIAFKLTSKISAEQIKQKVNKILTEAHADAVIQNDAATINDRQNHIFNLYNQSNVTSAKGATELVSQIVKAGFL
jgi:phosphopantothenoylcysteine decarboxylase/phosphopantothenate--cysteine ligase